MVVPPPPLPPLPKLVDQVGRLLELGLLGPADTAADLQAWAAASGVEDTLLVLHPGHLPASRLAASMSHRGRPGFVVADLHDVDDFAPIEEAAPPAATPDLPAYLVHGPDRGDAMADWSPDEALPAIVEAGRSPLTLVEGIHWVLQQPAALQRNYCFMTIGSRLRKADGGLDARTPAVWLSNGTGRDGPSRRDAPKVGWCWAGNRHTWLGFASAAGRSAVRP